MSREIIIWIMFLCFVMAYPLGFFDKIDDLRKLARTDSDIEVPYFDLLICPEHISRQERMADTLYMVSADLLVAPVFKCRMDISDVWRDAFKNTSSSEPGLIAQRAYQSLISQGFAYEQHPSGLYDDLCVLYSEALRALRHDYDPGRDTKDPEVMIASCYPRQNRVLLNVELRLFAGLHEQRSDLDDLSQRLQLIFNADPDLALKESRKMIHLQCKEIKIDDLVHKHYNA